MESHTSVALVGNFSFSYNLRCPDNTIFGSIPNDIKTLDPCLLCEEQNYDVVKKNDDIIYNENGKFGIDSFNCTMLLDEKINSTKLLSSNGCEFLRGECVTCGSGPFKDFLTTPYKTTTLGPSLDV
jgi:hypothetical protein